MVHRRFFNKPDVIYRVADVLEKRNAGMFSWSITKYLGKPFEDEFRVVPCARRAGTVRTVTPFEDRKGFGARFSGWTREGKAGSPPHFVVAVDGDGRIRGLAEVRSPKLRSELFPRTTTQRRSFAGYIADYQGSGEYTFHVIHRDRTSACMLPVRSPNG
jgi:hypothetical protein